jgi:hypothetical protein
VDERIDVAHRSLLAVRTDAAVAKMCARRSRATSGFESSASRDRGVAFRLSAQAMVWRCHGSTHPPRLEARGRARQGGIEVAGEYPPWPSRCPCRPSRGYSDDAGRSCSERRFTVERGYWASSLTRKYVPACRPGGKNGLRLVTIFHGGANTAWPQNVTVNTCDQYAAANVGSYVVESDFWNQGRCPWNPVHGHQQRDRRICWKTTTEIVSPTAPPSQSMVLLRRLAGDHGVLA